MDINKLQVARDKNQEDSMVKKLEESLSYGLQTLAEIMREHLTFRRECILTAFSLTPTQPLYQKIVQLAQESNFKTSESSSKNDTTENDFDLSVLMENFSSHSHQSDVIDKIRHWTKKLIILALHVIVQAMFHKMIKYRI